MTPQEAMQLESVVADLKSQKLRYSVLLDRTEHLKGSRYRESIESDYREICQQLAAITPDYAIRGATPGAGGTGTV